jgi:hypothetical protein
LDAFRLSASALDDGESRAVLERALDEIAADALDLHQIRNTVRSAILGWNIYVFGLLDREDGKREKVFLDAFKGPRENRVKGLLSSKEAMERLGIADVPVDDSVLNRIAGSGVRTVAFVIIALAGTDESLELAWFHPSLGYEKAVGMMKSFSADRITAGPLPN